MTHTTDTQQALFAPFVDEVPVESKNHTTQEAQVVVPEEIKTVDISFYDYELYTGDKLIACITYDCNDFVTQPWMVMINGAEIHRADTWAKCHSYIQWHYKQGTLPVQKQDFHAPITNDNEVMAQIATECEKFDFDLYDNGIFHKDVKLGKVGCTEGKWWVLQASSQHQEQIPCNSAFDAVWSLWMVEVNQGEAVPSASTPSTHVDANPICGEELLDRPFDELSDTEWGLLKKYEPLPENVALVAA